MPRACSRISGITGIDPQNRTRAGVKTHAHKYNKSEPLKIFNTQISQKVLVIRKTAVILSQKQNKTGLGRYPEQTKTKSNMEHLTNEQIADMSRREINAYFRKIDDSNLWPICGRFNATERAIRRVRKFEREYGEKLFDLNYYLAIKNEISNIVNDPRL